MTLTRMIPRVGDVMKSRSRGCDARHGSAGSCHNIVTSHVSEADLTVVAEPGSRDGDGGSSDEGTGYRGDVGDTEGIGQGSR